MKELRPLSLHCFEIRIRCTTYVSATMNASVNTTSGTRPNEKKKT